MEGNYYSLQKSHWSSEVNEQKIPQASELSVYAPKEEKTQIPLDITHPRSEGQKVSANSSRKKENPCEDKIQA